MVQIINSHPLSYQTIYKSLGFDLVRFKTGTPPRVNSNTIDYSKTEIQPGDDVPRAFSYETTKFITDQLPCWLTYTNETTHAIH